MNLNRFSAIWVEFATSPYRRALQYFAIAGSLLLMAYILISNLSRVTFMQLDLVQFFFGWVLTCVGFWCGTLAWAEIIRAFEPAWSYTQSIQQHLWAIAVKYLPGIGWQQTSKMIQMHTAGIPVRIALLPIILEIVIASLSGLTLAILILVLDPQSILGIVFDGPSSFTISLVLISIYVGLPVWIARVFIKQRSKILTAKHVWVHLWLAELLDLISWIANGIGLWCIIRGLTSLGLEWIPFCIAALALSIILGLLVVVAPSGMGARDLVLTFLLQLAIPSSSAVIVSLISRGVIILAEFSGVLILLIYQKIFLRFRNTI